MIFGALFLLCNQVECMTVGSPVFASRDQCEKSVQQFGLQAISRKHPGYAIVDYRCVSFLDEQA